MFDRRNVVHIPSLAIAAAMLVTMSAGAQSGSKVVPAGAAIRSAVAGQTSATALTVVSETTDKGSEVTLFATVSGSNEVAPSGTITFLAAGKAVGMAPLVRGAAHLTVTSLPAGTTVLTAHYTGNQALRPSDSSPVNVYVDAEMAGNATQTSGTASIEEGAGGRQ